MSVSRTELFEFLNNLSAGLDEKYALVALGGTALTLHGIKNETDDIDFIVDKGDRSSFKQKCDAIVRGLVDAFDEGMAFVTPVPPDYVAKSTYQRSFPNIELYAMDPVDIVITKMSRGNEKDKQDSITAINTRNISADDITRRSKMYRVDEPMHNRLDKLFRELWSVPYGE